jgi:hypothetical protein
MRRPPLVSRAAIASAIAVLILAPDAVLAQARRSASPDGAAPASSGAPRGLPRSARLPFAGVWDGLFRVPAPDGSESRPMPIVMIFDVADSAKSTYSGSTILPNGARAPHLETTVAKGEMHWKQQNSGGGFWVYTGRFVTQDSVEGTAVLRDWPQLPAGQKPPAGTFALARRVPGA